MKRLLIFFMVMLISLSFGSMGVCEESTFKAVTKDYEEEDITFVKVEETFPQTRVITLFDIDFYIERYEESIERYKENIKNLKELRKKVEEEAKKVKLKVKGKES